MAVERSTDEEQSSSQNIETKETQSEEQMVSMSQVNALIEERLKERASANRDADLATTVATAVAQAMQVNQKVEKFDELQYLTPRQMAKDDYLEEPVVFWTLGVLLVIGDDRRNRVAEPAPYGTIVFKPQGEKRVQKGKETEIQILGTFESWSKIEVAWLKAHSLCGTRFFEKGGKTIDMNKDLVYANKVAQYAQGLMGTHASQIIKQCQAYEIPVLSQDVGLMRIAIAQKKATEEMVAWETSAKATLGKTQKSKLLMQAEGANL